MTPDLQAMTAMRANGLTYREIGEHFNLHLQRVWQLLNRKQKPDHARLWSIDNAPELVTWLTQRNELHIHHEQEKQNQSRWMLVERKTAKCGTRRCLKVPTHA